MSAEIHTGDRITADDLAEESTNVDGREIEFTNLDKVLYPDSSTTKADVIAFYGSVAPAILPHLEGRPVTLRRFPEGVNDDGFFEKRCPPWRPDWVSTAAIWTESRQRHVEYCVIDDLPTLLWAANLADLEMHTMLARADDLDRPMSVVFDLDPGPGNDVTHCAGVALWLRDRLGEMGLTALIKSSGSKGLHVHVPLNSPDVTYDDTKPFARDLARRAERERPKEIVARMTKSARRGKVFIDWSQNSPHKTTVAPFSLRARARPTVAVPLYWSEVEEMAGGADVKAQLVEIDDVPTELDARAELFTPLLREHQDLPTDST